MSKCEEEGWWYFPQVPIGFGATFSCSRERDAKCVEQETVTVLFLDTHMEIYYKPRKLPSDCEECRQCSDRVECLIRSSKEGRKEVQLYFEPLNACPSEPSTHPAEGDDEGFHGGPYGCPTWCRGGLLSGAYPWPV